MAQMGGELSEQDMAWWHLLIKAHVSPLCPAEGGGLPGEHKQGLWRHTQAERHKVSLGGVEAQNEGERGSSTGFGGEGQREDIRTQDTILGICTLATRKRLRW